MPKVVGRRGEQCVDEKSWDVGRRRRREILSNEERAESKDGGLEGRNKDRWDHLGGDAKDSKILLGVEREMKEDGDLALSPKTNAFNGAFGAARFHPRTGSRGYQTHLKHL